MNWFLPDRIPTGFPEELWRWPRPAIDGASPHGCVCPAGAEKTCRGALCPRKAPPSVTGKAGV